MDQDGQVTHYTKHGPPITHKVTFNYAVLYKMNLSNIFGER